MKFADPKNDIAFKRIFGDEKHTEVLISFLNSVLDFKGKRKIKEVKIVNPYQVPKIKDLKNTILDIKAKNENGDEFIVEMQVEKDKEFAKRSLYYTSKSYVNQITKGEEYPKLKKVYFIGILDFNIFSNKHYISRHLILNKETLKQELKDFEFNFIELPKFKKKLNELKTTLDKWIYFIKEAERFEMIPKEFKNQKEFIEAFERAKIYNWNKDELEVYDYVSLREGRKKSEIETAREDGKMEGKMEAKIEIAKNLLKAGVDIDTIQMSTGLDIQTIENLKGKNE
jgi:predicted transposase/invertase (TIGR01784 family)